MEHFDDRFLQNVKQCRIEKSGVYLKVFQLHASYNKKPDLQVHTLYYCSIFSILIYAPYRKLDTVVSFLKTDQSFF
jgi:hypothetical protein